MVLGSGIVVLLARSFDDREGDRGPVRRRRGVATRRPGTRTAPRAAWLSVARRSGARSLPGRPRHRVRSRIVDDGSTEVNAHLRAISEAVFTAKDFRTWGGSVTVAEVLVGLGPPRSANDAKRKITAALDAAAARLDNTRAVCRKSYVNPRVPESYVEGSLVDAFERARERDRLRHAESAVLLAVAEARR
jgi:hypothetical protein